MTSDEVKQFANDWIASWNSRDLENILSHYEDDFEMSSPGIQRLAGEPTGTLRGKAAVGEYWAKALAKAPNLRFELLTVFTGVNGIVVAYAGHRGLSAEVFEFGRSGKVARATAHYEEWRA